MLNDILFTISGETAILIILYFKEDRFHTSIIHQHGSSLRGVLFFSLFELLPGNNLIETFHGLLSQHTGRSKCRLTTSHNILINASTSSRNNYIFKNASTSSHFQRTGIYQKILKYIWLLNSQFVKAYECVQPTWSDSVAVHGVFCPGRRLATTPRAGVRGGRYGDDGGPLLLVQGWRRWRRWRR